MDEVATVVNRTPHAVHVVGADGTSVELPSDGPAARVAFAPADVLGQVRIREITVQRVVAAALGR